MIKAFFALARFQIPDSRRVKDKLRIHRDVIGLMDAGGGPEKNDVIFGQLGPRQNVCPGDENSLLTRRKELTQQERPRRRARLCVTV